MLKFFMMLATSIVLLASNTVSALEIEGPCAKNGKYRFFVWTVIKRDTNNPSTNWTPLWHQGNYLDGDFVNNAYVKRVKTRWDGCGTIHVPAERYTNTIFMVQGWTDKDHESRPSFKWSSDRNHQH